MVDYRVVLKENHLEILKVELMVLIQESQMVELRGNKSDTHSVG
jgi:hypothetical protein